VNRKLFWWVAQIGIVVLAGSLSGVAEHPREMEFRGSINDYTPQNMPTTVMGPWQVTGQWSLRLKREHDKADFSAALTMVRSDQGVLLSGGGDLNSATQRMAHTHHILLAGGTVTPIANGFRVFGPATITANGNFPPPFGGSSSLQVDIVGGNTITPSNIKLTFSGDAMGHFGSQAINGVVRSVK
jgi:hypothetical protein